MRDYKVFRRCSLAGRSPSLEVRLGGWLPCLMSLFFFFLCAQCRSGAQTNKQAHKHTYTYCKKHIILKENVYHSATLEITMCTERQTKRLQPCCDLWVLVFCESAPLHGRHKSIPAVLSQRQHWGWMCCLLLSSVGRHEHLPKPLHLHSTCSHLLPPHFLAWLLQNTFNPFFPLPKSQS